MASCLGTIKAGEGGQTVRVAVRLTYGDTDDSVVDEGYFLVTLDAWIGHVYGPRQAAEDAVDDFFRRSPEEVEYEFLRG